MVHKHISIAFMTDNSRDVTYPQSGRKAKHNNAASSFKRAKGWKINNDKNESETQCDTYANVQFTAAFIYGNGNILYCVFI